MTSAPPLSPPAPPLIVVMGVSGAGKTLLARCLAAELGVDVCDADNLHSPANVSKMRSGTPLTDADRAPWLDACHIWLVGAAQRGGGVLACSALKLRYRHVLRGTLASPPCGARAPPPCGSLRFGLLSGDEAVLRARVAARAAAGGHYMPPSLLDSQLAALEAPAPDEEASFICIDFSLSVSDAAAAVVRELRAQPPLQESRDGLTAPARAAVDDAVAAVGALER